MMDEEETRRLETIVEENPKDFDALIKLGGCYWDSDQIEKAEEFFFRAVSIHSSCELASKLLFHILWDQKKNYEALEEMKRFYKETGDLGSYKEILDELTGLPT